MSSGVPVGTGVTTLHTGIRGVRSTGTIITDIIITGTIIITDITATGIITGTQDIMTFITVVYVHTPRR